MRRSIVSASILLLLFIGSLINIHHLKTFIGDITADVETSSKLCCQGRFDEAEIRLREALGIWQESHLYTHTFLRHTEIDTVTDSFYNVLQELGREEPDNTQMFYAQLLYHLQNIVDMECLQLESVF